MEGEEDFEARRLENIKRNRALLDELGIHQQAREIQRPLREQAT